MTQVEFDNNLKKINFNDGVNTPLLEDFLLACLSQLEECRFEKPSLELFLTIFDQARNGPRVEFDSSWKDKYSPEKKSELNELAGWDRVTNELRFLVTDLIHTRKVRNQSGYIENQSLYEWDTEGGVRFYNGTTPCTILGYAATRFTDEYHPAAFQEREVDWDKFTDAIWIGISYE